MAHKYQRVVGQSGIKKKKLKLKDIHFTAELKLI